MPGTVRLMSTRSSEAHRGLLEPDAASAARPALRGPGCSDAQRPPATAHLWHLWPGRHWPLLREEEAEFVAALAERSEGSRPEYDRGNLIAVLNSLRCGLSLDELLALAPGLEPAALLVAYEHLDSLRSESVNAWAAIVADPSLSTVTENLPLAGRLLPVAVYRVAVYGNSSEEDLLHKAVTEAQARMSRLTAQALDVEEQLRHCQAPSEDGVRLGRRLYDPYDPQLWGEAFYLPERVGALMPVRVADLLGEPRS